jgi:DNA-binding winged helix-turn-helix (wHTH) protein
MEDHHRYSSSYRAAETRQIVDWIRAGQCGSIIGLPGAGKSIFLRFMFREDVRRYYLGRESDKFVFILVDLLSLVENSDWAVCELILSRLARQLRRSDVEQTVVEQIALFHQEVIQNRDMLSAHRTLEKCMDVLCEQSASQVILFFDEFDTVFKTFDPTLFRYLRGLRDAHNGQPSYIVSVTSELTSLRDDLIEVDHFYRLVNRNSCWLGPLCEADAREMIGYVLARRSMELTEADILRLMSLSGKHPGLLQAMLGLLLGGRCESSLAKLETVIQTEPEIQRRCQKIWDALPESEQALLCSVVNGEQTDLQLRQALFRRGLLQEIEPAILFSPIFAAFAQKQAPPSTQGTYITRSPQIVQLDGRRIQSLTELEFELLCYLYEQRGRICTKNDLIENVYRHQYEFGRGDLPDEMLQALISRLRKKIELNPQHPRYIVTVRGEGYRFVELCEE